MTRILLTCLLIATFESPIGQSMDSFVLKYEVRYCAAFINPHLQIIEQVVNGKTGARAGNPRSTYYPLPEAGQTEPVVPTPDPTGWLP